jgi:hypothetical protein
MIYVYILVPIFLVVYFALMIWMWRKRKASKFTKKDHAYINSHWYRILDSFEKDPRVAVMEGDKLLDYCLTKRGGAKFSRLSLGEKLKKGGAYFTDINSVWSAHKLRNKIAHELGMDLPAKEARRALGVFKKAMNDLGAKL